MSHEDTRSDARPDSTEPGKTDDAANSSTGTKPSQAEEYRKYKEAEREEEERLERYERTKSTDTVHRRDDHE